MTLELLEERLAAYRKDWEWELNEWYEKFNALHLRLSKRVQRAAQQQQNQRPDQVELDEQQTSVLHYRRPGSP